MSTSSPDWKKVDKLAEQMYNILHDEKQGVTFLEIDCILNLLQTQCDTQKFLFIIRERTEDTKAVFSTIPKNIYG